MVPAQQPQDLKILLLEGIHPKAQGHLEAVGFEVESLSGGLTSQELINKAREFDALGIRSKTQLSEDVLEKLSHLWAVGCFCIGTDQVALDTANHLGVPVFNAPYSNTRSVAELVISEMIALSRQLGDRNMLAHQGQWLKSARGAHEVRGKTLGIVGYGHIGSQVSILAEALGLKVMFYDIVKKLPLGNAEAAETLEDLLKVSDFVTLHVPETRLTQGMIGEKELKIMKPGAFLLNLSRGTVVDIPALASALEEGHIAGAAIDVYPKEPASNKEIFKSELQNKSNVILTPHIGGSTEEAQEAIGLEVSESLVRYLTIGNSMGAVNFPNLDISAPKETRRLLNVHKNVPGVLSEINSIVSKNGVNIRRQMLSTDPNIGYLIMDMELEDAKQVAEQIQQLSTSIKTRIV